MTLNEAYRILGINSEANSDEIKSAFRKKAIELHPDKNPNKDTHEDFIEIVEAYEYITKPKSKKANVGSSTKSKGFHFRSQHYPHNKTDYSTYQKRYDRAKKFYNENFEKKSQQIYKQNFDEYMNGNKRRFAKVMAAIGIIFCFLLIFDYSSTYQKNFVLSKNIELKKIQRNLSVKMEKQKFPINRDQYLFIQFNCPDAFIHQTHIFKDIIEINFVSNRNSGKSFSYSNKQSHKTKIILYCIFMIIPLLTFFFEKPSFNFVFWGVYYNIFGFPIIMLIFLFSNMRIERLYIYLTNFIF